MSKSGLVTATDPRPPNGCPLLLTFTQYLVRRAKHSVRRMHRPVGTPPRRDSRQCPDRRVQVRCSARRRVLYSVAVAVLSVGATCDIRAPDTVEMARDRA